MRNDPPQNLDWQITETVELMREISRQTDPQELVRSYRDRTAQAYARDATISLSRRGLEAPYYRITRYTGWADDINPWKEKDRLPVLRGGLLADLIYGNEPCVISDLAITPDEPAFEYLEGMRTLVAIPHFDRGVTLNMVLLLLRGPDGFDRKHLPNLILTSNLFGRAVHNLVMAEQVREAYEGLDAEFKVIADIQRSLLPPSIPTIPGLEIAEFYATATRAGGDYYDFFPIGDGRLGMLIADVSGHGAAAAVVMARMHAALHAYPGSPASPPDALHFANEHLLLHCRTQFKTQSFVTAFYAVYDPSTRTLIYSAAGHNPPRRRRSNGDIEALDGAAQIPLGINCGLKFEQECVQLDVHEDILLYTDGMTEAMNPQGEQFGVDRLDQALGQAHDSASAIVQNVVRSVDRFVECARYADDRTLLALHVY